MLFFKRESAGRTNQAPKTFAYYKELALRAHARGDYLSAAQHLLDAADCQATPALREACLKLAEKERTHEDKVILVE